jgi:hypothetical protein
MNPNTLTSSQLIRAAKIKDQIDALNKQLNSILGGSVAAPTAKAPKGGMSSAGRARIAAAQRRRWAKIHAAKGTSKGVSKVVTPSKMRPKISPEGLARIKAAQKARWAKIKAAKKK